MAPSRKSEDEQIMSPTRRSEIYIWKRSSSQFPAALPKGSMVAGDVVRFDGDVTLEGSRVRCHVDGERSKRLLTAWMARVQRGSEIIWVAPRKEVEHGQTHPEGKEATETI